MFIHVKPESFADVIIDCANKLRASYGILSKDKEVDEKLKSLAAMGKAIAALDTISYILDDAVQGGDAQ